jgi:hypothetical protein
MQAIAAMPTNCNNITLEVCTTMSLRVEMCMIFNASAVTLYLKEDKRPVRSTLSCVDNPSMHAHDVPYANGRLEHDLPHLSRQ